MTVTVTEAVDELNLAGVADLAELVLYVDAANEWVAARVTDTSPAPVRLATLMLIGHLWETQRGPGSSPLDGDSVTVGKGYAIPNRVKELLAPYPGPFSTLSGPSYAFPDAVAWPDPLESV